jgi:hypothetical protein
MSEATPRRAPSAELVASMLGEGCEVRLRLTGWSMKPWFRSGALVRFSATRTPAVGDIALTRHANDALVAHRIVALGADWVQTKGDACLAMDGRVARSSLIGCAVAVDSTALGLPLPLGNAILRTLGRVTNRAYPVLVRAFRALHPRKDPTLC